MGLKSFRSALLLVLRFRYELLFDRPRPESTSAESSTGLEKGLGVDPPAPLAHRTMR